MSKFVPTINPAALFTFRGRDRRMGAFEGSEKYWENRYSIGGTSGNGSYNQLAAFKAEVLNRLVAENDITSVISYGCGDGNQLSLARYPQYIGFDVSPTAISTCRNLFSKDESKDFRLIQEYAGETAELTLSLDVIFHIIEDDIFDGYMARLFDSAERFVAIYSSDTDNNPKRTVAHVRHRKFSRWVASNKANWTLFQHIPNKYPFHGDTKSGSFSDFYIYCRN